MFYDTPSVHCPIDHNVAGEKGFMACSEYSLILSIDLKIIVDRPHTSRLRKQEIIRATLTDSKFDFYQYISVQP